ncbi:MAG: metal-dependent hydrolase [Acidobacteriota bacterium]|nr:metal-dependent hydrolase [Acidobacteriota bacterium]
MSDSPRPSFTYYGHASVRVDFPDGQRWLIDPWVQGNPSCPESLHDLERLDALLVTHSHADHFADAVKIAKRYGPKKIVANFEICTWLTAQGVGNAAAMNLGGSQDVLGHRVTMVRADHSSGLDDDGVHVDGGSASGFIVHTAEDFTFYHAGDTALFSDMQLIASLYRPRLGFVPIGDLFTMGPADAARACRYLGVATVVPIHWGTFPVLTGTPAEFERQVKERELACDVVTLQPGESY